MKVDSLMTMQTILHYGKGKERHNFNWCRWQINTPFLSSKRSKIRYMITLSIKYNEMWSKIHNRQIMWYWNLWKAHKLRSKSRRLNTSKNWIKRMLEIKSKNSNKKFIPEKQCRINIQ